MEMKLSGTRIRELRLKLSWSQEKLAEEAGLNARTVQRVETDGSASLRTRLALAEALQVLPETLNAEPPVYASAAAPSGMSIYYFTVLVLVSIVYLAAQPAYFSLSVTNFSWINYGFGRPWHAVAAWWVANTLVVAFVCVPILLLLYRKHRRLFLPYLAAFSLVAGLSVLRLWEPEWIAQVVTAFVSVSGFGLLLSLYVSRLNVALLRHVVYICLSAYLFLWFFQDLVYFLATAYEWWKRFDDFSVISLPKDYLLGRLPNKLGDLAQLIPLGLVLALSLGKRPAWSPPSFHARAPDLPLSLQ